MNHMKNEQLDQTVTLLVETFRKGGKLLICGNGGSAADSAHIAGELVKGFRKKRPLPKAWSEALGDVPLQMGLPAIDLTAQSTVISATANDLGGALVYAQQVMAYGCPGDVLLGISTSGNADNVLMAMRVARIKGLHCVALTGRGGGKIGREAELVIASPETETYRVQEMHIVYYHELCARVEAELYPI